MSKNAKIKDESNNDLKKQKSKRVLKSNSNSLNLKNNYVVDEKDFKWVKIANAGTAGEEFLDTSALINKLFANKRDSIDFSMNSFKIEKDSTAAGAGKTTNNLNYVNKASKVSEGKSSKPKDKHSSKTNLTSNKDNSIKKEKNNTNIEKTSDKKSYFLTKNMSSGLIKKPKIAEFFLNSKNNNELEKQSEKDDLKLKITPYINGFNSKLFNSSNTNNFDNSKSTNNLIKKEKYKNNLNINSNAITQLKQTSTLVKNENSFSPTYKLRKDYSEINTEKIRKLASNSQEKNVIKEASSRTKSNSKEKNGFFDKKNNISSNNKEKNKNISNSNSLKTEVKDYFDLKSENKRFSRNEELKSEKILSDHTQNSNPFSLPSNPKAEGKQRGLNDKQLSKMILGKTKSKIVMIDLNSNSDVKDNFKKENKYAEQREKQKEIAKDVKISDDVSNSQCNSNNKYYLSPDNIQSKYVKSSISTNKFLNNNNNNNHFNHKINSFDVINKSNTLKEELNFLKSESKNSFNIANKEFAKAKSKLFTDIIINENPNKELINPSSIIQINTLDTNTLNLDDYTVNPEQNIYKSSKVKRVLKKEQNEVLVCSSAANNKIQNIISSKEIDKQRLLINYVNNFDGGKELEEHEIILNRSGSHEKIGNNRYEIVNNITEKIAQPNCKNKKEKKNICGGNNFNFKINLKDFKDINFQHANDSKKNEETKPLSHNNFSILNHPNYLKMKEYSIKKVNTNLYEENFDTNPNRYGLKKSNTSSNNHIQNQNKETHKYERNQNYIENNNDNNYNNKNTNFVNKENKIFKIVSNFTNTENRFSNKTNHNDLIQNGIYNNNNHNNNKNTNNFENKHKEQKSGQNFSAGRRSNRLTDAREKRFSNRISNENRNTAYANNSSTEKNSDIKKLNEKLNDVCHNLTLFKMKSDSLRNSTNIENSNNHPLGTHLRKESSDFEVNYRRNMFSTGKIDSDNFEFNNRKENFNALRSSDPINYTKNNKLDSKFVKQVIISHR